MQTTPDRSCSIFGAMAVGDRIAYESSRRSDPSIREQKTLFVGAVSNSQQSGARVPKGTIAAVSYYSACAFTLWISLVATGCDARSKATAPSVQANQRELSVAAASDLRFALDRIIADFEERHPNVRVKVTYGSSGNFYAQLSNRAPFDLFLSADISYPQKLADAGLADKNSIFTYGIGSLVVCARKDSKLDIESLGMDVLTDPSIQKIAIANPRHAPYGRAAEAALKHFKLYDQVAERLVMGENVAQTAVFVESGSADVGMIARSLAMAPVYRNSLKSWRIPQLAHPRLEQGGVILSWSGNSEIAKQFCDSLIDERGRTILTEDGFDLPD